MGHRANFVLMDDAGWRLHYSHWAGTRVASMLVAGPAAATRFVAAQRLIADREHGWLDSISAEGGAVVDHRTRHLVCYEDGLAIDPDAKRAFMRLLEVTWPDWTVRWAYDGLGDLAAHVGVDPAVVHRRAHEDERFLPPELETDLAYGCHLLTVRDAAGRLTAYPFHWDVHTAWHGPGLLERLPSAGFARMDLPKQPDSGLHVDVPDRTGGVWLTGSSGGLVRGLAELWPGWRMRFWEDRYEEQLRRCAGAVTAPPADLVAGLDAVPIPEPPRSEPVADMPDPARHPEVAGPEATVHRNPPFTARAEHHLTPGELAAVRRAVAGLRARLVRERAGGAAPPGGPGGA